MREVGGIKVGGITSSLNIELAFKEAGKIKGIKKISDVRMPIVIPATDLATNKEIIFTNNQSLEGENCIYDIDIAKAVRASSSFPGMYAPFEYQEFQFVDGGICNNLPVKEVKKTGVDKVIAVKFDVIQHKKVNTLYNIAMQAVDLMTENLIREQITNADCLLDIDLKGVKAFSINKLDFCYEEGYKQTLANMHKIKKCLKCD